VRKAFKRAAYTIKGGKILVKDGEILQHILGNTIWLDVQTSETVNLSDEMRKKFREYWTVEYENYPVTENYLKISHPITVKAGV